MPVKRVILLRYEADQLIYALRADVPAGHQTALPGYVSIYGDVADPDLVAIQTGAVIETVRSNNLVRAAAETPAQFRDRVEGMLEAVWAAFAAEIAGKMPRRFYGRYWTGTAWSNWP